MKLTARRASREPAMAKTEADVAQRTLLAADIKRFLERPSGDPSKIVPGAGASGRADR